MKKLAIVFVAVLVFVASGFAKPVVLLPVNINAKESVSHPRPKYSPARGRGHSRAYRKLKYRFFTVNVYQFNRRVRVKDDRETKALYRQNKRGQKAHRPKKTSHILLKGSTDK